jgi:hypothetical protein
MRVAIVATSVAGVLMLAGWAAGASAPLPPKCSAQQGSAFAFSGGWGTNDKPGYAAYCGPGKAVIQVEDKSFTIQGGHCTARRVRFGYLWNGVGEAPAGRGLWLLLEPRNRPGRIGIADADIQLPGIGRRAPTATGTAIVAKGLKSATFSLRTGGGIKFTGRWTCG